MTRTLQYFSVSRFNKQTEFHHDHIILTFVESINKSREIVLPYTKELEDHYHTLANQNPGIFARVAATAYATPIGSFCQYIVNTKHPEAVDLLCEDM